MHRLSTSCAVLVVLALGCSSSAEKPKAAPAARPEATPVTSKTPAADPSDVAELVSGVGIGLVRVGMTRAELDAVGLAIKPGETADALLAGPYRATLEGDRVTSVRVRLADLPAGARVGGAVFTAGGGTTIKDIAEKLPDCGPPSSNVGGDEILCDGGKTQLLASGPPGIVTLAVHAPAQAAKLASAGEGKWTHPQLPLSFSYDARLLEVSQRPDGAVLKSEILGKIEDRSGEREDTPQPLVITVAVRPVKRSEALAAEKIDAKDCESASVAGQSACLIRAGSHDMQQERIFAEAGEGETLQVTCDYLGDMGQPKVPFEAQVKACRQVFESLAYKR
ncbi:hypothetical protein [Nannocystis punicea]|uniref:Uncharacterized protein n=1 Tax=Nannocystis punicea TaxID=2995304 RepID=A0ABY7GVB1_9BACT|nr:hypothetical protein [Nannocystis poenicansa]WAS90892.1 hypothetical protein O0S08_32285 [Nannocystis poenicansa]